MFELFTDEARRIVVIAQEDCRNIGPGHIGTEHLLLALTAETVSAAGQTLQTLGVTRATLARRIIELTGRPESLVDGHIAFTDGAKEALQRSHQEATDLGSERIGSEHILLSLVRDPDSTAAQLLQEQIGSLDRVRDGLRRTLGATSKHVQDQPPPETGRRPTPCKHPSDELRWEATQIEGPDGPIATRVVRCALCSTAIGVLDIVSDKE